MAENMVKNWKNLTDNQKKYILFKALMKDRDNIDKYDELISKDNLLFAFKKGFLCALANRERDYNKLKNDTIFVYYNNIISNLSKLARELKIDNSLEASNLFTFLLWNGYFSFNKRNLYQVEKRNTSLRYYAFDIMRGIGVCLNHSEMLKDFLNNYGYKSSIMINLVDKKAAASYKPDIVRNAVDLKKITLVENFLLTPFIKKIGNHAFNLISDDGKIYIYDSTNFLLLKVNDYCSANVINGTGIFKLSPYFSQSLILSQSEQDAMDQLFLGKKIITPYDEKEYISSWEKDIEVFNSNIVLIDDFYDDSINDISLVADQLVIKSKRKIK